MGFYPTKTNATPLHVQERGGGVHGAGTVDDDTLLLLDASAKAVRARS
jgi:hypothetical protein